VTPPAELPVAVLDSSVLVPVWSRLILQRLAGRAIPPYAPVWSEWIIAETWRTLALLWVTRRRPQASLDGPGLTRQANQMLRYLLPVMRFVSLRDYAGLEPWHELTDPDDAPVWQTAVLAKANYVVSHNTRHFPPLRHGRHAAEGDARRADDPALRLDRKGRADGGAGTPERRWRLASGSRIPDRRFPGRRKQPRGEEAA